jgi:hypothetical protein
MIGRCVLGAMLVFTLSAQPVFAWGDAGHRMVCRVAWDELREKPMADVKELLGIATEEEFAETCTWADRYLAEHPETAGWHEVYVTPAARDVDMARDCSPQTSCSLREIERNLEILKSGAPREERATALKFLAHFVGDAHQPLRVGFLENRAGAGLKATFLGHETNLREVWDTEMLATDPAGLEAIAGAYRLYTPLDRLFVDWIADLPAVWATESLWIMRTPATGYVGNPGGLSFDETYVKQNLVIAHDRIAKAGMRLGHLINEALREAIPR